jgi:ABC-type antimicrobial peptide transport system permease subunit
VTRRTGEIGVRVAVGARPGQVLWLVLRQVLVLAVAGVALGAPLSLAVAPVAGSLLYGVAPDDPLTLVAASLAMVLVALAAGLVPALRASRLHPTVALRAE